MGSWRAAEDALVTRMVGRGAKNGSTWFGRVGDVTKRPPVWMAAAGAMALTGPRGRQAAVRASAGYAAGVAVQLAVKRAVGRGRPPGAGTHASIGPLTSSFPSGHCASELAFSLGAAQEIPWLFVPLYAATFAGEWSLVRSRAHYPSDIFGGAAVAVGLAIVGWKLWPPHRLAEDEDLGTVAGSPDEAAGIGPGARRA